VTVVLCARIPVVAGQRNALPALTFRTGPAARAVLCSGRVGRINTAEGYCSPLLHGKYAVLSDRPDPPPIEYLIAARGSVCQALGRREASRVGKAVWGYAVCNREVDLGETRRCVARVVLVLAHNRLVVDTLSTNALRLVAAIVANTILIFGTCPAAGPIRLTHRPRLCE
jgi:hypothetical protein